MKPEVVDQNRLISRVRVSHVASALELQDIKRDALRMSASSAMSHSSGDVRASFGFMPVNIKNAVIHWPAL
jgi:hypothetical protein